jgi:hypothetical protein
VNLESGAGLKNSHFVFQITKHFKGPVCNEICCVHKHENYKSHSLHRLHNSQHGELSKGICATSSIWTSKTVSGRCSLLLLLPDWGHQPVIPADFGRSIIGFIASLVLKNLHIAWSVQSIILHLKRSWFSHQETFEKSLAMIYLVLHALIEILREQGPLVSCKVIPLLSITKMSTSCACLSLKHSLGWFKGGLKEWLAYGLWLPCTGQMIYVRIFLVGARKSTVAFMFKSPSQYLSHKGKYTLKYLIFEIFLYSHSMVV